MEVSGEATIRNAAKVRDLFQSIANGKQSECRVNLSGITDIDLSFFQLLVSFRMTMLRDNKKVTLDKLSADHIFNLFTRDIGYNTDGFFSEGGGHGI